MQGEEFNAARRELAAANEKEAKLMAQASTSKERTAMQIAALAQRLKIQEEELAEIDLKLAEADCKLAETDPKLAETLG